MNNKTEYLFSKPSEIPSDKQLFSSDLNTKGAKKFIITTYEHAFQIIKETGNLYEDHTHNNKIKLHIDIDFIKEFQSELERDQIADNIINSICIIVNNKLKKCFDIDNPRIVILISDNLSKLSLHIIYIDIVFSSIFDMKCFFTKTSELIDMNIYRKGCFRMIYCNKFGKNNKLKFYCGINYTYPNNKYQVFLDSAICYITTDNIYKYNENIITNPIQRYYNINNNRNYYYKKYDLEKIEECLLKTNLDNYNDWLIVSLCIKDLYLGIYNEDDRKDLFYIYDNVCKKAKNYNYVNNYNTFIKLNPIVDINYLFNLVEMNYHIHPFYDYKNIIFNIDKHTNKIIQDEKFINIDINELVKYKTIFIKSPTGTGKTTLLKNFIKLIDNKNIISITSRVNLAGEHTKHLNVKFYKDLDYMKMKGCHNIVIQLESIWKINYNNFIDGIVILDEINSLLSHLRSPTFTNKRAECYRYLIHLIKNASYIIGLDADLSDWNIEFIKSIRNDDYIVYNNICKNKINTEAEFFICDQIMIDIMVDKIKNNEYFMACFDSLKKMNSIIEYLSTYGKKEDWKIYSSEVQYDLIDTESWRNKFIFFTPTILYGIDFNLYPIDVFCFIHKFHLNPLQIYQMISRARQIKKAYIYCHERLFYLKYKSVKDVDDELKQFEKNFLDLLPYSKEYCKVDENSYRIMYINFRYMDSLLKTNIKYYLIDHMIYLGYDVCENKTIVGNKYKLQKKMITKEVVKSRIIELLKLNINNLTDFDKKLVSNDKFLEKHFNLRIFINNNIDDKMNISIISNLFTETIKNKFTKIKTCKELMNVLEISSLEDINRDITKKFNLMVNNTWLNENFSTIKKLFEIRGKKYEYFSYYNIYMLLIIILKNLFDEDIFKINRIWFNKKDFYYYTINNDILTKHLYVSKKVKYSDFE